MPRRMEVLTEASRSPTVSNSTLSTQGSLYHSLSKDSEEIRLLSILPFNEEPILSCTMSTRLLHSQPSYTALSYVWGDQALQENIIINDQAVLITKSLATALRAIRARNSPETTIIWVDAICINQKDGAEKAHQVQIMGTIYRQATQVLGWLGEKADDSDFAINLLQRIAVEILVDHGPLTIFGDKSTGASGVDEKHTIVRQATQVLEWLCEKAGDNDFAIILLQRLAVEILVDYGLLAVLVDKSTGASKVDEEPATELNQPEIEKKRAFSHGVFTKVANLLSIKVADGTSENPSTTSAAGWLERIPELLQFVEVDNVGNAESASRVYNAISNLLDRPYWRRLWIRQEIALAQDLLLLCGDNSIPWVLINVALKGFGSPGAANAVAINPFARQWSRFQPRFLQFMGTIQLTCESNKQLSLVTLVGLTRGAKATNPRDYIYGLLGLVDSDIKVDYSLPPQDLYTDFYRKVIVTSADSKDGFMPLYYSGIGYPRQLTSLPSWVIDLSTHGDMGTTWDRNYDAAGKTSRSMAEFIVDGTKLKMKGVFVDQIAKMVIVEAQESSLITSQMLCVATALFEPSDEPGKFLRQLFGATMLGRSTDHRTRLNPESLEDQDMFAAFISSLSFGIENPESKRHELKMKVLDTQVRIEFLMLPSKYSDPTYLTNQLMKFTDMMVSHIRSQVVFRTAKGLLGVGLPASQNGDIVCIVPGHTTPLLIRPSGVSHQLVSTCYVQGLMDGEATGDDEDAWLASLLQYELI